MGRSTGVERPVLISWMCPRGVPGNAGSGARPRLKRARWERERVGKRWELRSAGDCAVEGGSEELGGLAALDVRDGDVGGYSFGAVTAGLDDTPAFSGAIQALLLLFKGLRGRIHQAEHLIHRLAAGEVVIGEPANPIVRAAIAMPPPIDAFSWVLGYAAGQREPCPLFRHAGLRASVSSRRAPRCAGNIWLAHYRPWSGPAARENFRSAQDRRGVVEWRARTKSLAAHCRCFSAPLRQHP